MLPSVFLGGATQIVRRTVPSCYPQRGLKRQTHEADITLGISLTEDQLVWRSIGVTPSRSHSNKKGPPW